MICFSWVGINWKPSGFLPSLKTLINQFGLQDQSQEHFAQVLSVMKKSTVKLGLRNSCVFKWWIALTVEARFTGPDNKETLPLQTKNKKNLDYIKTLPCVVCRREPPSDPDHVKTRGSGGSDSLANLNPVCRPHHVERHSIGIKTFLTKYYSVILENRKIFNLPKLKHGVFD